jgi:hypothetical protein
VKEVHCRKCWQTLSPFNKRCAHCGELDRYRFGKGLVEMVSYTTIAAAGIGLAGWAVVRLML